MRILHTKLWSNNINYSCNRLRYNSLILLKSKQSRMMFHPIENLKYYSIAAKIQGSYYNSKEVTPLLSEYRFVSVNQRRNISSEWLHNLAVFQSKWFKSLSESSAVEKSMTFLKYVHDSLHVPWWLSIIISTVLLRSLITFPLAIYQQRIFSKVENLKPEMDELMKELKRETGLAVRMYKWNEKHTKIMFNRSARRIWKELIIRENCHPFKAAILLWAQIPLWIILTVSLRNMATLMPRNTVEAQIVFAQMSVGGFGWIPNLIDVDHSLILPIAMGIFNIFIIDINETSRIGQRTKGQKYVGYFFKSISILIIPIAALVPANVVLYWTTSSLFGVVQNLLLLNPRFKRLCRIPPSPSERTDNPYQYLFHSLGNKYLFIKKKEQT